MYKKSFYNVEIDKKDNCTLIYNTHSGVFSELDTQSLAILNSIDKFETINAEDADTVELMNKAGFIVSKEIDEKGRVFVKRKLSQNNREILDLIIAPTMNCNMACPYCFETHSDEVMDESIQKELVAFAERHIKYNKCSRIEITWYGGEPLLEPEIIYSLSDELIRICEENKVSYGAKIITNGALLTKDIAEKLKEKKVSSAQITIDGPKEIHDNRRMLIKGKDSFDLLIKNIEAVKDIIHISVRINVDSENENYILDLAKYFLEDKGWVGNPSFYLAPVDNASEKSTTADKYMVDMEKFAALETEIIKMKFKLNREIVKKSLYPFRRSTYCGAERTGQYVVAPDGLLYSCWNKINVKELNIGDVTNGPILNYEHTNWLSLELSEDCKACVYLPCCQGGCPFFRLREKDNYACFHGLYSYKNILKIVHQDFVAE